MNSYQLQSHTTGTVVPLLETVRLSISGGPLPDHVHLTRHHGFHAGTFSAPKAERRAAVQQHGLTNKIIKLGSQHKLWQRHARCMDHNTGICRRRQKAQTAVGGSQCRREVQCLSGKRGPRTIEVGDAAGADGDECVRLLLQLRANFLRRAPPQRHHHRLRPAGVTT